MAEKFLGLENEKQRVIGLDIERFTDGDESRALVVTAERARLSLFWTSSDGAWRSWTRRHDALERAPRRPDHIEQLGWSNRVGIGVAEGRVGLVYRRRFNNSARGALWVDRLSFNANDQQFTPDAAQPVRVPNAALGIERFGFSLWAGTHGSTLLIVAQAWFAAQPDAPRLVLLRVPLTADLTQAASWSVHDLDEGGYDCDARCVDGRLSIIHRRSPGVLTLNLYLPIDPFFAPTLDVELSNLPDVAIPLETLLTPLTWLEVEATTGSVLTVDASLPGGEHPRLIGGGANTPVTYTVDRWTQIRFVLRLLGGAPEIEFAYFHVTKALVTRSEGFWRQGDLLVNPCEFPRNLAELARAHRLVGLTPVGAGQLRLELATLFDLWPWRCLDEQVVEKGRQLVLGHHDDHLGALVARTIYVVPDGDRKLAITPTGSTILDINRSPLADLMAPDERLPENAQFAPFNQRQAREQSPPPLQVIEPGRTGNTIGGLLAAHHDEPTSFFAYVDMGDGGGRVCYDTGFTLQPPGPPDPKELTLDMVPEPAETGRAWVTLTQDSLLDSELAGYLWAGRSSLASQLQEALDGLVGLLSLLGLLQEGPLPGGGRVVLREGELAEQIGSLAQLELTPGSAAVLQEGLLTILPVAGPFRSAGDAPFEVAFRRSLALVFVGVPITFTAVRPDPEDETLTFQWEFLRPNAAGELELFQTAEGPSATITFNAPTVPNLSLPGPQPEESEITARLTVSNPEDVQSSAEARFAVSASLWADLWSGFAPFRLLPDNSMDFDEDWSLAPGFETRDASVALFKYRLRYLNDASFVGQRVVIDYRETHDTALRFRSGEGPRQGAVELHARLHSVIPGSADNNSGEPAVVLTGTMGAIFGAVAHVERLEMALRLVRRFTPGTTTSELRDGNARSELLAETRLFRPDLMLPNALNCKPVGPLSVEIDLIEPRVRLSLLAWVAGAVVPAIIALGLGLPALLVAGPLLVGLGLSVGAAISLAALGLVVSVIIAAGLGLLLMWLFEQFVFKPWVTGVIREQISAGITREQFARSGMLTHAGEGLAEALAVKLIEKAIEDGYDVEPPQHRGRNRFRPQFFETVVVAENGCKAKIRVR